MGTLNYSTTIPAGKTTSEIQALLARHGATAVATRYEAGLPTGLSFGIQTAHGLRFFDLPVNAEKVFRLLKQQADAKVIRRSYVTVEQAHRTAWRVVKVWVEAQVAIIETEMVSLDQVMLPYLRVDDDGRTLYEAWRTNDRVELEP